MKLIPFGCVENELSSCVGVVEPSGVTSLLWAQNCLFLSLPTAQTGLVCDYIFSYCLRIDAIAWKSKNFSDRFLVGSYSRLVRRRVASVSDIDDGLKESPVAAATASSSPVAPAVDATRTTSTMRAELFNSPSSSSKHRESSSTDYWPPAEATIVIELEEYTSMANELADIKSQLITLQNLLVCDISKNFRFFHFKIKVGIDFPGGNGHRWRK